MVVAHEPITVILSLILSQVLIASDYRTLTLHQPTRGWTGRIEDGLVADGRLYETI